MYQAPVIALVIGFAYAYRKVTAMLELRKPPIIVPLWARFSTFVYLMMLILTVCACCTLYYDVLAVTDNLDPETVRQFVYTVMAHSDQDKPLLDTDKSPFTLWEGEADLAKVPWLKYLALSCPLWCVLTLIVCAYHTLDHVKAIRRHHELRRTHPRDCLWWNDEIILILALPAIYGLMSFKGVIRCLQIYINHVPVAGVAGGVGAKITIYHSYQQRKALLLEMYASNFAVGDIMETVALVAFGKMIANYLKVRMRTTEKHMNNKGVDKEDRETMEAAQKTVTAMTISGVRLFCLACLLSGGWDLLITTMPAWFPWVAPGLFGTEIHAGKPIGILQQEETRAAAEKIFLGFSFAASFAAIGNIMTLEGNYHHFLSVKGREFNPSPKFWGTKILVSLASIQSIVLLPLTLFCGWSTIQEDLLYACILCFECLVIALFHFKAWGAKEAWLEEQVPMLHHEELQQPLIN